MMKSDYTALRALAKGVGAKAAFSSILSVRGKGVRRRALIG